jgi:hypothetical protein
MYKRILESGPQKLKKMLLLHFFFFLRSQLVFISRYLGPLTLKWVKEHGIEDINSTSDQPFFSSTSDQPNFLSCLDSLSYIKLLF